MHRTITLLRPRVDSPLGRGCSPTASRGGQIYCSDPERRHGRQRRVCHSGERRDDCTARLLGSHRWRLFLAARQISDADTNDGIARIVVNKVAVQVSNPEAWINDSAELAKQFAYAVPVSTGTKFRSYPGVRNKRSQYRTRSGRPRCRRLANLINTALRQATTPRGAYRRRSPRTGPSKAMLRKQEEAWVSYRHQDGHAEADRGTKQNRGWSHVYQWKRYARRMRVEVLFLIVLHSKLGRCRM